MEKYYSIRRSWIDEKYHSVSRSWIVFYLGMAAKITSVAQFSSNYLISQQLFNPALFQINSFKQTSYYFGKLFPQSSFSLGKNGKDGYSAAEELPSD